MGAEDNLEAIVGRLLTSSTGEAQTPSILIQAAMAFSHRPFEDEDTMPTGFDPLASALFEGLVESAYLVAGADGVVDPDEREILQRIVTSACAGIVKPEHIQWLFGELDKRVKREGAQGRMKMIAEWVTSPEHRREVLRVAALVAKGARGVGPSERQALVTIASAFGMPEAAVDEVVRQAAL